MPVNKKLRSIYDGIFDGMETLCHNSITYIQENIALHKYCRTSPPRSFKKQVHEYWKKYNINVSPKWAWYYASKNGIYDPRYIPNTLYYTKIDQYFNKRKLGWGFNDKNYYSRIFPDVKQPDIIIRKINGFLLDANYKQLTKADALELIRQNTEIVCKPSLDTGSGRGLHFWKTQENIDDIKKFLDDKDSMDYVVQKVIRQHPDLNKVHASSINTLRIVSILLEGGVHILSSNLRMGTGDKRIDNVSAGGISIGINADGRLKKYASDCYRGIKMDTHPQGLVFEGFKVPSYNKAIKMVESLAPTIPNFRLVSWDIAIDENGEPILIEANMRKGMINLNQFNNGPLFGDLTDQILGEVFNRQ